MAHRRSAAAPVPPALLALRVSSANAESVSGNRHKFFSPARNLLADRAAASPLAGSHPGNTGSSDIRAQGIGKNRRATGSRGVQNGRPSRDKGLRGPERNPGLRDPAE